MTKVIPLTQHHVTVVDDEDYENLSRWSWLAKADGHLCVARSVRVPNKSKKHGHHSITVYMARQILGLPQGDERQADHISGDTLDNRRENLRIVSATQNGLNKGVRRDSKTGVTGVRWSKQCKKWIAEIRRNGQYFYLGLFKEFEDAVAARRGAELSLFGEFVRVTGEHPHAGEIEEMAG